LEKSALAKRPAFKMACLSKRDKQIAGQYRAEKKENFVRDIFESTP
jgi:hypothetical protein